MDMHEDVHNHDDHGHDHDHEDHDHHHDHDDHDHDDHDHDHGHTHTVSRRGRQVSIGAPATIQVMICKGFSGEIIRAEIFTHDIVSQAIPEIADQIHYYSPDFEKIGLYNLTQDFEYRMEERFCDHGTNPGDLIVMADGGACHKD
jgi:ABC-type Zn2+ transport system substrate-binding protein/surface adhesin